MDGRFRTMTHPGLSPAVTVTVFPSGKMRMTGYKGASFDMMRTYFERVFECLQWKQASLRPDAQSELEWQKEVANPTGFGCPIPRPKGETWDPQVYRATYPFQTPVD